MKPVITEAVQSSIKTSVLCWLATVSKDGVPNVSPKEAWVYGGNDRIWVANIASPNTVANIRDCSDVCLSFVDVLTQKGFKIVGKSRILERGDGGIEEAFDQLSACVGQKFTILSVIEIIAEKTSPIIAPSYTLFPDTTEREMVDQALKSYRMDRS